MPSLNKRRSSSARTAPARATRVESLEPRLMLYAASGYSWSNPNISFSFVPDGANVEGYSNTLFSKLNAMAPTAVWQREFARALQTWANASNLNFHEVVDTGLASGTFGSTQGDARFGDIRLAAHALSGPLAYAYYPSGGGNTIIGDVFLSTEYTFRVGGDYDLYSVLLHEVGHSLGLGHSSGSVMNSYYQGIMTGLTADDVAGIQAIYGARRHDAYDAAARNDQRSTATTLTIGSDGKFTGSADLQSLADVDYYAVAAPTTSDGSFNITVSAAGLSLLAPRLAVYNSAGALLGVADAGSAYGTNVMLSLTGVAAGEVLYVMADGATSDAFGMGGYQIQAAFGVTGGGGGEPTPPPSPSPAADRYEVNDSRASATNLGRFNSKVVSDVTLHTASDVDFYRFSAQKSGSFRITAQFDAGSASQMIVYDSSGNMLAQSTSGSVTISLATGATAFVSVSSPTGALDTYDLAFARFGGGGKPNQKGGLEEPDMYFAEAGHDHHDHGSEGDGGSAKRNSDLVALACATGTSRSDAPVASDASNESGCQQGLASGTSSATTNARVDSDAGEGIQRDTAGTGVNRVARNKTLRHGETATPSDEWLTAADHIAEERAAW